MFIGSIDKKVLQEKGVENLRVSYFLEYTADKNACDKINNHGDYDEVNSKVFSSIEDAVSLFLELQDNYQQKKALKMIETYHLQLCIEVRLDNILVYDDLITWLPHGKDNQKELILIANNIENIKKMKPYYDWIMQENNKYVRDIIEKDIKKAYKYGMKYRPFDIGCQPKDGLSRVDSDASGEYYNILYYERELTEEEKQEYELDFIRSEYENK